MKQYIHKIFCFSSVILILLISACNKNNDPVTTTQTIDEVINSNPDFSLYAYAVKKTNLDIFTKGGGPFTFFIPSNSGFSAIGINSTADIDNIDPLNLAILASYHFQGVLRTFYEIPEGPNAAMTTQTGLTQYGTRNVKSDKAYVNGVELLDKGTLTSNGIYYKVGDVIQPPIYSNAIIMLQGLGSNYSLMLQAITKTATTTSFTTVPSTVFLLQNSVMLANGYDSTTIANITGTAATTLTNILRYHVIPQRVFKSDFKVGTIATRYTGNSITVSGTNGNYSIQGKSNAAPTLMGNGVATTGGVAYSIAQMLKP